MKSHLRRCQNPHPDTDGGDNFVLETDQVPMFRLLADRSGSERV